MNSVHLAIGSHEKEEPVTAARLLKCPAHYLNNSPTNEIEA